MRAMSVELCAGALGDAHAIAVLVTAHADARRLVVLRVHDRHVGDVDRALLLDHAHRGVGPARRRAHVALDHVDTLDVDPVPLGVGADDLALLDRPLRVGLLDRRRDDVPHARVAAARAALHADAEDLAGAGVVGDLEAGLVLDHLARSTTSTSLQRLLRDIGRHSWTRTVSPVPASLRSSWACSLIEVRMILW